MAVVRSMNVLIRAIHKGFTKSIGESIRKTQEFKQTVKGMNKVMAGSKVVLGGLGHAAVASARKMMGVKGSAAQVHRSMRQVHKGLKTVRAGMNHLGRAAVLLGRRMVTGAASTDRWIKSIDLFHHHATRAVNATTAALHKLIFLVGADIAFKGLRMMLNHVRDITREFGALANKMQDVQQQAERIGMSTKKLSGLDFAAKLKGMSSQQFSQAINAMMQRLGMLASGARTTSVHLRMFGLSAATLASETAAQALSQVADAMHRTKNAADRAALAQALFGRGGVAMINVLQGGNAELMRQVRVADRVGVAFNSIQARKVIEANDALTRMAAAWTGLKQSLIIGIAPYITVLANSVRRFVTTGIGGMPLVAGAINGVGSAIAAVTGMINVMRGALDAFIIDSLKLGNFLNSLGKAMHKKHNWFDPMRLVAKLQLHLLGMSDKQMNAPTAGITKGLISQFTKDGNAAFKRAADSQKAMATAMKRIALRADAAARKWAADQRAERKAHPALPAPVKAIKVKVKVKVEAVHLRKARAGHMAHGGGGRVAAMPLMSLSGLAGLPDKAFEQRERMIQVLNDIKYVMGQKGASIAMGNL